MKPHEIEDIYELSPLQQGILFHQLQSPDSRVYYVQATAALRGPLNEDALGRAWQRVVDRNTVLRTGFRWQELDKPLQIVHRHVAAPIAARDWRLLAPDARRAQLDALAASEREREIDLSAPPLVRLALVRTADEEHELVWSHHHILMDGWSFNLLLSELAACYDAFARGEAYSAPLKPPYRRYVEWLQGRDAAKTAAFWRARLAGKTAPTRIAGVSAACRGPSGPATGFEPVHASRDVMDRLAQASRRCRVTMNTMALAAWALVLRRHSGDADVLFGVTVSGRSDTVARAESMIGLFINTVPIRIAVPPNVAVAEWVRAIQDRQGEALAHAHAALVDIRRVSDIPPGWPFFDSLVVFERYPVGEDGGASGEPRRLAIEPRAQWTEGGADYPLTLCVAETSGGLAGTLSYDATAVDRTLGARLARHFERVLESLAAGSETRVADLEMLTPGEREQLLTPPAPLPAAASSVCDLFEAQVRRTPDRLAVVDEHRGWTYSELDDAAGRVAAALRLRGAGAESLVGIYAHRSVAMVAALLGTQKARAAFLPLDPAYPSERLRFMIEDAKATAIVTDRRLCGTLPATAGAGTLVLDDLDANAPPDPADEPVAAHPHHLAYVLYTSGSTGRPKGIAIEQRSAVAFMQWARATYDDGALAGVLATTSISYDCSIFEIFAPLCWGGTVILAASAMQLPPDGERATLASMLPSTLLAHLRAETLPRSLRAINVGGEFSPKDLCGELNRRERSQMIYHVYGPAEDTTYSTVSLMRGDEASLVSIGAPLPGKAAYVLDTDGSPAPAGVAGELHLSGIGLARGYCGKPDLTADRFIPDPFSAQPGARMYRTGDLARVRPDGELELLGRLDRQIKLRGARVEAREIEAVLEEHPAVEEAVVTAVRDAQDETRLVGYLVAPHDQAPPDRATLRLFAKTRLPAAIVPSQFVFLREFVRMPNGKIDLRALPDPPEPQAEARDHRRTAPRDDVELQLTQAWEELLGTSPVGVQDDFFELGGHSLKALALVSRIQRTFGRRIPFSALLDRGTVERLADLVRGSGRPAAQTSLVKIKATGSRPPLFLAHPGRGSVFCYYELAQYLARDFDVYGLQSRALDGELPPRQTIEEMAADYLREIDNRAAGQPFVIAGWCMGGLVAFEMARQWRTSGRGAPPLAILDADAPASPDACRPADDDVALLASFAEHLNLAWGASAPSLEELRALPADRVLATVLERAKKANAVPAGISLAEAQLLFDLFKINCRAERAYAPAAYDGDVLLFRALEPIGGEVLEPDLGWTPLADAGRLRVRDVPGNHHTMLHEPHVAALADEVLAAVNAYAESSPSM